MAARRLIVNADDLGYDPGIDRGILEAHARGIVRSATAMVVTRFAEGALRSAPRSLGVGLHLVLGEGLDRSSAAAEILRQLDRFEALRGAPPTHLDGHKHAHARAAVLDAVAEVAGDRGLPVRALDGPMRALLRARGVATTDAFLGDAALRPAWTEAALLRAIDEIAEGVTEIMAHPGHRPEEVATSFGVEREEELRALTAPAVAARLRAAGVLLSDYGHLGRAAPSGRGERP